MSSRNLDIDTARGIACILLVAFHVVGNNETRGLHLGSGSDLRLFSDYLAYIRMPLFTFLSGFVYSWRPFSGDISNFIKGKARRLLIPMFFLGTLFAVCQKYLPMTNSKIDNLYLIHIVPVGHFWFIESLFIVFMVVMLLEKSTVLIKPLSFFMVFISSIILFLWVKTTHYFSIQGAIYLFPFFLFGVAVSRFNVQLLKFRIYLVLFLVTIFVFLLSNVNLPNKYTSIALIIGLLSSFLIVRSGFTNNLLAYIGAFSYSIYLFHVFFTASVRMFMMKLGIDNIEFHFMFGLATGLFGPILIERLFQKTVFFKTAFLGKK